MQRPCPQWKTPGRAPGRQRDFFRAVRRGVPVPALRLRYEKSPFRKAGTVVLIEAMLIPHFRLEMARPPRLERGTLCLEGRCSIQLSYGRTPENQALSSAVFDGSQIVPRNRTP